MVKLNRHLSQLENYIGESLDYVGKNYRSYDPGNYLYRMLLSKSTPLEKFSDEHLELLYVTLAAWGMRTRGAKLTEFNVFKNSILSYEDGIRECEKLRIENLNLDDTAPILETLKIFYDDLLIVPEGKPKFVAFAKTMHFLLPGIFVPMDRTYTLGYFLGRTNLNGDLESHFQLYSKIYLEFAAFAVKHKELSKFLDDNWNQNIPKIMDNIIIGHVNLQKQDASRNA